MGGKADDMGDTCGAPCPFCMPPPGPPPPDALSDGVVYRKSESSETCACCEEERTGAVETGVGGMPLELETLPMYQD